MKQRYLLEVVQLGLMLALIAVTYWSVSAFLQP